MMTQRDAVKLQVAIEQLDAADIEAAVNRLIDARLKQLFVAAHEIGTSTKGIGDILEQALKKISAE